MPQTVFASIPTEDIIFVYGGLFLLLLVGYGVWIVLKNIYKFFKEGH